MTNTARNEDEHLLEGDFSETDDLDPAHMDAQAIEDLRTELQGADPKVVISNHCYGLFELAAVYLAAVPAKLSEAQLAIDALAAVVEGLGERLAPASEELAEGLAQLRLAYVQIHAATTSAN
ncbi:MAG: hypothetical protein WCL38_00065 [Actinomycetota bacterium]